MIVETFTDSTKLFIRMTLIDVEFACVAMETGVLAVASDICLEHIAGSSVARVGCQAEILELAV